MAPSYFPLRWESTGDQWWYASPIDFAAANGHYDLVRELLHLDTNLLIKLTSLRRIRRLETVWDDEEQLNDVANCRALVAKKLLSECETKKGYNTLIRAGYGGWLLYTAASAGDLEFVKSLLERDANLVFGEGEYGVTDVLYAAARSKNCEVFRVLLNLAIVRGGFEGDLGFRKEMMSRGVHGAARGGNLEILKELRGNCGDMLEYRDAQGSTVLHSAAGRGQVQVVKDLIASLDLVTSTDYQGNTALHIAAYRGYLAVAEILIEAAPSLASQTNNYGDTFLHMALSGFRAPGFRRVDKQIELVKQLVSGKIVNIQEIINVRNKNGRTALHMAVIETVQSYNLAELLMKVPTIDLNISDVYGMTPLDLLKQRPRSATSEILIKQLISAGGVCNCQDQDQNNMARNGNALHLRGQGIGMSPGTSFRVSDSEIFLYTGVENETDVSCEITSVDYNTTPSSVNGKYSGSVNNAGTRLKSFLQWPRKNKEKKSEMTDDDSLTSFQLSRNLEDRPIPLRQRFSELSPESRVSNNKRMFSFRSSLPSPLTRKKFTAGLTHGVIRARSGESPSTSSPLSVSSLASPASIEKKRDRQFSFNKKMMNKYLCFGAQGLPVDHNSMSYAHQNQSYKHSASMVA
ncbi:ankyrin repeat-containing protein ITN1-like [Mercurialis annua]|uniref:ankyrin repeat-containing protein ITN1-like n=1 Tax=Mercurialis annua TaxID=3986 RepID=UPI00215F8DB0|nr:ankyrin repeat-containing protein ITN1-like [Mercurialis annua]